MTDAADDAATTAATRSLARDADATRARIASTFDDLQARLAPQALLGRAIDGAVGKVSTSGMTVLAAGGRLFKLHPIAVAVAGMAFGLALFGRAKVSNARVNLGDIEPYSDFDDGYGANMLFDDAALPQAPSAIAGQIDAHPLAAAAVAIAAGALVGALFNTTETERALVAPRN